MQIIDTHQMTPSLPPLLAQIVERLREEYRPERIILYGSYAYGTPNEDSDIDLFIVKESPLNRIMRAVEVRRILTDPKRRISISPRVYTPSEVTERLALGDQFVEEVMKRGVTLYEQA